MSFYKRLTKIYRTTPTIIKKLIEILNWVKDLWRIVENKYTRYAFLFLLILTFSPSIVQELQKTNYPIEENTDQHHLSYSYDGRYVATINKNGVCRVIDTKAKTIAEADVTIIVLNDTNDTYPKKYEKDNININILFRPKTYEIIISQESGIWKWYPLKDNITKFPFISDESIDTISFNSNGTKLVTVGIRNQVIVWNVDEMMMEEIYNNFA